MLLSAGRGLLLLPPLLVILLLACWADPADARRGRRLNSGTPTEQPVLQSPPQTASSRPSQPKHGRGWRRRDATGRERSDAEPLQPSLLPPPADTWRAFIRHTEDTERRAQRRRQKKKRRRGGGRSGLLPLPTVVRRGPVGPPGPPGPPGAIVTEERLVTELRNMIQEAAGEHLSSLLNAGNETGSDGGQKRTLPSLFRLEEVALVSRVQAAFHVGLAKQVAIPPKMFVELGKYQLPFGGGSFQRGATLNLETGRFSAPEDGVYQLSAQIFLRKRPTKGPRRRTSPKSGKHSTLRVSICIDSLCKRNSSLQYLSSVEPSAQLFTASINGVLELRRGQYVSVHIDNATRSRLVAVKGSQFSGAMLGR